MKKRKSLKFKVGVSVLMASVVATTAGAVIVTKEPMTILASSGYYPTKEEVLKELSKDIVDFDKYKKYEIVNDEVETAVNVAVGKNNESDEYIEAIANGKKAIKKAIMYLKNGIEKLQKEIEALPEYDKYKDNAEIVTLVEEAKNSVLTVFMPEDKDDGVDARVEKGVKSVKDKLEELKVAATPTVTPLDKAKEEADKKIDALANLSEEEKKEAKAQVKAAQTEVEVDSVVKKAEELDAKNSTPPSGFLDDIKEESKNEIDALVNLSEAEKKEAKEKIKAAQTEEEIESIVEKADELDAKEEANKKIDALANLSEEEKKEAKAQVKAAQTELELDAAVKKAEALSLANKNAVVDPKKVTPTNPNTQNQSTAKVTKTEDKKVIIKDDNKKGVPSTGDTVQTATFISLIVAGVVGAVAFITRKKFTK